MFRSSKSAALILLRRQTLTYLLIFFLHKHTHTCKHIHFGAVYLIILCISSHLLTKAVQHDLIELCGYQDLHCGDEDNDNVVHLQAASV